MSGLHIKVSPELALTLFVRLFLEVPTFALMVLRTSGMTMLMPETLSVLDTIMHRF
jgi:hypothetical protein